MAAKLANVTNDKRYHRLRVRYRRNWVGFSVAVCDTNPTLQQIKILTGVQQVGSRISCSSGHGTGKSHVSAVIVWAYLLFEVDCNIVLTANTAAQITSVLWKYLKKTWKVICKNFPWLEQYFVVTDTAIYATHAKGVWCVTPKTASKGNEEALAGQHNKHYLVIVDEASAVGDKALGVLRGALTEEDNRMLMLSQPTRPSGFFYDTHHSLKHSEQNPDGAWTSFILSSAESPLVTPKFIMEKYLEYGGFDDPEFQIKVLGQFPKNASGYLLSRAACERAQRAPVQLSKDWGWVACADIGNGRDRSVLSIFRVSGHDHDRRVIPVSCQEMPSTIDPVDFARHIIKEVKDNPLYPNITVCVDADGVGHSTARLCEDAGLNVQRIRWGFPCFSDTDKNRFYNLRAMANVMARDAVNTGRMRIDGNKKTIDQASRIPSKITETGHWLMMKKEDMKKQLNISSPDRWDTYCFAFLASYTPARNKISESAAENRSQFDDLVA